MIIDDVCLNFKCLNLDVSYEIHLYNVELNRLFNLLVSWLVTWLLGFTVN